MNKIIITSDLGRVRAFRLEKDPLDTNSQWHATEVEVPALAETPEKVHDEVSDQAGEFARGSVPGEPGGMSYGEEHNAKTEQQKKLIRGLAHHIGEILEREKPDSWELAAPKAICTRLEAEIDPQLRKRLNEVHGLDLTKVSLKEIEERFSP